MEGLASSEVPNDDGLPGKNFPCHLTKSMATMMELAAAGTIRAIAWAVARRRLKIEVEGVQNVGLQGPVLLAARHFHYFYDGPTLIQSTPRRLHILISLDWVQGRAARILMEWATSAARWPMFLRRDALAPNRDGTIPQKGSAFSIGEVGRYRRQALPDAVQLLVEGSALLIFPEGYPNIDLHFTPKTEPEELLPFHSGFAVIASIAERRLGIRIPVVPIGLSYVPGDRWKAKVRYGEPFYLASCKSRFEFIRTIQRRVAELSDLPPSL